MKQSIKTLLEQCVKADEQWVKAREQLDKTREQCVKAYEQLDKTDEQLELEVKKEYGKCEIEVREGKLYVNDKLIK